MKKLLILSGKGGTGKTTTAAAFINLSKARAFADCDVDAPNLHLIGHFDNKPSTKDFIGAEKAVIDTYKCIGCGLCLSKCRFDAISQTGKSFSVTDYACEGCGLCAYLCPQQAIKMVEDVAGFQQLYHKKAKLYDKNIPSADLDARGLLNLMKNSPISVTQNLNDNVNTNVLSKTEEVKPILNTTNDNNHTDDEIVFSTAHLKMGRGNSGKLVTAVKADLLANAPQTELAIIDGSPGLGCPVIASMNGVDLALVVAEPSLSGFSDLERLVLAAKGFRVKLAVCVNKWDISAEATKAIEAFCKEHQLPFLGRIPYDPMASKAINNGISVVQIDCPASRALREIYVQTLKLLNT